MLSILLTLLACSGVPGLDSTNYDACITWTEIACACGNIEANMDDPEFFCDPENVKGTCDRYDMAYCDTQSSTFDADRCEGVHSWATESGLEWQNCWNRIYADECGEGGDPEDCGPFPQPS